MSAFALDARLVPTLPRSAIVVSVAIHAAALLLLPGLAKKAEELPPLVATLRFLPAAETAAAEPVKAPAPQHQTRTAIPLPQPTPSIARTPVSSPSPQPVRSDTPTNSEAPAVAAAAPSASPARSEAAPVSAAPIVAHQSDNTALDEYGRALSDLLARQQQYPRLAALRGWEGEVRLRLKVARKGNLVAVQVVHSSGHEVLDQHAVQLVQGAALPSPPDSVGDREIQIVVPINYKLQKSS